MSKKFGKPVRIEVIEIPSCIINRAKQVTVLVETGAKIVHKLINLEKIYPLIGISQKLK